MLFPKIIHFFWMGEPIKPEDIGNIQSFQALNPDHQICLWCFEETAVLPCKVIPSLSICFVQNLKFIPPVVRTFLAQCKKHKKYQACKDILQIWILYEIGGHFFDVDVFAFSIAEKAAFSERGVLFCQGLGPGAMSATRGHKIFQHLAEQTVICARAMQEDGGLLDAFIEGGHNEMMLSTGMFLNAIRFCGLNINYAEGTICTRSVDRPQAFYSKPIHAGIKGFFRKYIHFDPSTLIEPLILDPIDIMPYTMPPLFLFCAVSETKALPTTASW